MTREQLDKLLREYAGDDTNKIIAWIRSSVLSDKDVQLLCEKLGILPKEAAR